jgi:hypothetical protein
MQGVSHKFAGHMKNTLTHNHASRMTKNIMFCYSLHTSRNVLAITHYVSYLGITHIHTA